MNKLLLLFWCQKAETRVILVQHMTVHNEVLVVFKLFLLIRQEQFPILFQLIELLESPLLHFIQMIEAWMVLISRAWIPHCR